MSPAHDLSTLWQKKPTADAPPLTLETLRARGSQMARASKRRNARELVAGALGIAAVTWCGFELSPNVLSRVGCALLVAGTLVVFAVLWKRGRPRPAPAVSASTREHLAHYRAELVRERDLLRSVWGWYIGPIAPGLLVWLIGLMSAVSPHAPPVWTWLTTLVTVACGAGIFAWIARVNRGTAEKLARQIEALDAGGER